MYNISDFYAACESLREAGIQFVKATARCVEAIRNDLIPSLKRLGKYMNEKWKWVRIAHSIEYKTAATQYPKLAHLARHAKKKRVRKKNTKRLYQIGDDILCGRQKL